MNEVIIALAKASILLSLHEPHSFDLSKALEAYPELKKNAAVFVTLNQKETHTLRGCIGTLEAYQPLYKDIIKNAQYAALKDSRFKPLTASEFKDIEIEVSVLSETKILNYTNLSDLKNKITPYHDGVVLKFKDKQATYLPQVWEQLPTFHTFFESLCMKAGLPSNCLEQHPQILIYHVTEYKETP